jgi:hypothetical protein
MPGHGSIIEKLLKEGNKTEKFFFSLQESQWEIRIYNNAMVWKVRHILAHFISSEDSFLILFEKTRKSLNGIPSDFSIDEFNNLQVRKMEKIPPSILLNLFHDTRKQTVNWVAGLSELDFNKKGLHPSMGETSLQDMIKMIYIHNQMHLRDIRAAIGL